MLTDKDFQGFQDAICRMTRKQLKRALRHGTGMARGEWHRRYQDQGKRDLGDSLWLRF